MTTMRCFLPFLLLIAPAWGAEKQVLVSAHYVVRYWPSDQSAALAVRDMAEQAFFFLTSQIGYEPKERIEIELCRDHGELERVARERLVHWTMGLALSGTPRLALKASVGHEHLKHTLVHELSHVILGLRMAKARVRVPRWFDEGVAKYLSGEWTPDDEQLLAQAAVRKELIPLSRLQDNFPLQPERGSLAYAESCAFVKFLVGTRPTVDLPALMNEAAATGSIERALRRTWHQEPTAIEKQWRDTVEAIYVARTARLDVDMVVFAAMAFLVVLAYLAGRRARAREAERATQLPPAAPPPEQAAPPDTAFTRRRRYLSVRRGRGSRDR
jgi:hypothetical protein